MQRFGICTALLLLCVLAARADDLTALNAFKAGISNWDQVSTSPGFMGWNDATPCPSAGPGWTGVICAGTPNVQELHINVLNAQGSLAPGLSGLSSVKMIDLGDNGFTGPLPAEWAAPGAFPALKQLWIRNNKLSGSLPESWGSPDAFPALEEIDFQKNALTGQLPAAWGQKGGFSKLINLDLESNQILGGLPAEWGTQGGFQSLRNLGLIGNQLTGSLPKDWTFPQLMQLRLVNNKLTGPLPDTWYKQMPMLGNLTLAGNSLSGSIPANYGDFPNLYQLNIRPGNEGLCGVIPAKVTEGDLKATLPAVSGGYQLGECSSTASPTVAPAVVPAVAPSPSGVAIAGDATAPYPSSWLQAATAPAPGPGYAAGMNSAFAPETAPLGAAAPSQNTALLGKRRFG